MRRRLQMLSLRTSKASMRNVDGADGGKAAESPPWPKYLLVGGLGTFLVWGVGVGFAWKLLEVRHEWIAQWGDSFAPLTGIASTLAVVLALWSVNMQRRDLAMQRDQLELTREEMKAQRVEMEAQRRAQEMSAAAQAAANRIADVANAIAIEGARLNAYELAIQPDMKSISVDQAINSVDKRVRLGVLAPKDVSGSAHYGLVARQIRILDGLGERLEEAVDRDPDSTKLVEVVRGESE